jgi:uncharacterized membrane protein (DUF2068 family)
MAAPRREAALSLIIGYKLVKGVTWLVLAVVILVLMQMGLEDQLLGLADHLRHHAHAWSLELARLVVGAASRKGLAAITVALVADGLFSLLEGWALLHGRWWGPWLVVIGTSALLPFEVVALVRHLHPVRAVLFVGNIAIVWYLARKARREAAEVAHKPQS